MLINNCRLKPIKKCELVCRFWIAWNSKYLEFVPAHRGGLHVSSHCYCKPIHANNLLPCVMYGSLCCLTPPQWHFDKETVNTRQHPHDFGDTHRNHEHKETRATNRNYVARNVGGQGTVPDISFV